MFYFCDILFYLRVVAPPAAEEIAAVGSCRILVANAPGRAQDALLRVFDAVVGRLVDVNQVRLAQRSLTLRLRRRRLNFQFLGRHLLLHHLQTGQINRKKTVSIS